MERRDIDHLFTYHPPNLFQIGQMADIREAAKLLANAIVRNVPEGPDQSAAIRKVREAVMTANAGIVLEDQRCLGDRNMTAKVGCSSIENPNRIIDRDRNAGLDR